MPRFLFFIPPVQKPSGGVNVALEWLALLKQGGFDVQAISSRPDFSYPYISPIPDILFDPALGRAEPQYVPRAQRVLHRIAAMTRRAPRNRLLRLHPDDVIVVPDYAAGWLPQIYPRNRCILFAQAYWPTMDIFMFGRAVPERFSAAISTSDVCRDAVGLLGLAPIHNVPLALDTARFDFRADKKKIVAFMPRRRAREAEVITRMLAARGRLNGWSVRALDGLSRDDVAAAMGEALIFLSFSEREGFGLPPAEAMASGCITIGYDGVGGAEFFDPAWSFPVRDADLPGFVATVESVVAEYNADPTRLDGMRRMACDQIRARYAPVAAQQALLAAFAALDKEMADKRNNA